ncbi:ATP-binding cassette domain-containing protein [uncultured Clostridium sp.]|uniref:methionine ABC transporter ATP-binding protein n=1 Tax=uncultured Clostridium sp. TaxID=59620 RepID=UPI0025FD49BA|nr:ATP-binding cassette domain-containing protein [uncultured Clostridium sp.]
MIELKNVTVNFKKKKEIIKAIDNVSLQISKGDIFGIVGGSGAGKSTLLRTINGLQKPTSGEVIVDGQDITNLSRKELREVRKNIGIIFQHFNLISRKTVGENIEFALKIQKVPENKRNARVKELLNLVGLEEKENVYPRELSGGQKQRVGIARAIASNPKVLLCDEATSALDVQTAKEIVEILKEINKNLGITIVFITHQLEVAKELFKNIAVIDSGKIVENNSSYEIFANPSDNLTKKLVNKRINIPSKIVNSIGGSIVTLIYKGEDSLDPVISTINERYKISTNILHGNIEYIQDKPIGVLVISINGKKQDVENAIDYLESTIETVRYYKEEEAVV